jgi:hypothetical protein
MSDQVSAVRAMVEDSILDAANGASHMMQTVAGDWHPALTIDEVRAIVEAALRAVPLSAETAPAERERLLALDERVLALTLKGQPLTAADQSQVRSVIRQLLAAPTVAQAPQPSTRCPYCSFDPTSMNDYCAEHRPVRLEAPEGAAPAVSREATVPQGGEFTADEVDDAIESLRYAAGSYKAIRLLKRLRALSSAPGEREGR